MTNLWTLVSAQLRNLYFHKSKKGKSALVALIPVFALVYCAFVYNQLLYSVLPRNMFSIIPTIMCTGGMLIALMFGIPFSQGQLFGFSDFDTLRALPISDQELFLSKVTTYLIQEYIYCLFFVLPSMIYYGIMAQPEASFYLFGFVGLLAFPLIPACIAALIGLGVRSLTANMKNKKFFDNLFNVLLMLIIFWFAFSMTGTTDAQATMMFEGASEALTKYVLPVKWYVEGAIVPNIGSFVLFMVVSFGALGILIYGFSKIFLRINEKGEQGYHVRNFQLHQQKQSSSFVALFKKECRKYFGNFMYVMNTSAGVIIMMVGAIFCVIKKSDLLGLLLEFGDYQTILTPMLVIMLLIAGMFCYMSTTTGVSISLEGKNLWITKSLPIKTMDVFLSKAMVTILMTLIPSLIAYLLIVLAFSFPLDIVLVGIVYLIALCLFVSMIGLIVNLFFPKFDYDREILVIKQSASAMICILGGMLLGIGLVVLFIWIVLANQWLTAMLFLEILTAIYIGLDVVCYFYLKKGGTKRFWRLNN